MWIKVKLVDSVVCANFTSSKILDEDAIQQAGVELMRLVERASETKKLLLSFEGVQFMSLGMIGKLVLLNKKAKTQGVQLKFCDISPNVLEVFKIARLRCTFPNDNNVDEDD
ncbi:MAG: STAS domain-containing protein [Planctomycetes bacterium]|nr:STAS domain-containing protein [Planctomycetota bacterium]